MRTNEERRALYRSMALERCKHFSREPLLSPKCELGIDIVALVGKEPGWGNRMPCCAGIKFDSGKKSCAQRALPSLEEVEQDERDLYAEVGKALATGDYRVCRRNK